MDTLCCSVNQTVPPVTMVKLALQIYSPLRCIGQYCFPFLLSLLIFLPGEIAIKKSIIQWHAKKWTERVAEWLRNRCFHAHSAINRPVFVKEYFFLYNKLRRRRFGWTFLLCCRFCCFTVAWFYTIKHNVSLPSSWCAYKIWDLFVVVVVVEGVRECTLEDASNGRDGVVVCAICSPCERGAVSDSWIHNNSTSVRGLSSSSSSFAILHIMLWERKTWWIFYMFSLTTSLLDPFSAYENKIA